jgi:hypothetical protein
MAADLWSIISAMVNLFNFSRKFSIQFYFIVSQSRIQQQPHRRRAAACPAAGCMAGCMHDLASLQEGA